MTTPTPLSDLPFRVTPGEKLDGYFRGYNRAVKWAVYPAYLAGEECNKQKQMKMAQMIQDNLIGKWLAESEAFPPSTCTTVQAVIMHYIRLSRRRKGRPRMKNRGRRRR